MSVAPLLHQQLEVAVVPVGQDDFRGDEEIAGTARFRQALALEAEGAPTGGVFRDRQFHRAAERRHAHPTAEHRLVERDRQVDAQVAAVDLEEGMRRDADGDEHVTRPVTRRGLALPLQPDLLARAHAGRNLDIELLAARQPHALLGALDGVLQRDSQRSIDVEVDPDAAGVELEMIAAAARAAAAAEHAVEDVLEAAATAHPAGAASTGAEGIGLEAAGTGAAARVAAGKTVEARLALGVDLAAVELSALVLVAQDLVG